MSLFTIDYSGLDTLPEDSGPLRTAARSLKTVGDGFDTEVTTAGTRWGRVQNHYEGPGAETLAAALKPAVTDAGQLADNLTTLKAAAIALADEVDDLNQRRKTFTGTTQPNAESAFKRNHPAQAAPGYDVQHTVAENNLQDEFDVIAGDWAQAQQTFNTAVEGIARISTNTGAHFDYGTNSTRIGEAARLYRLATAGNATPDDVEAYYAHLAKLNEDEIAAFGAIHPEARVTPPPLPTEPAVGNGFPSGNHGAAWWDGLSPAQQAALGLALPALVGNTNGVPYTDRSAANVRTLKLVLDDPAYTAEQRKAFDSIADALAEGDTSADPGRRYLTHLIPDDPASGRALASVSIGNLDTADDVTVSVSGMGSGTHNMDGEVDNAQGVYNGLTGDRAVVTWLGYDSPDKPGWYGLESGTTSTEVLRNDHANTGGMQLAHFLDGFHETRDHHGDVPTTNVIAHSYGTTTAAAGLTQTEHAVDRYVMYGSAGIDPKVADHASDFNVKRNDEGRPQVYATMAYDDPWAALGQIASERLSPTAEEFGAYTFSSDGEGNVPGKVGNVHDQATSPEDDDWGYLEERGQSYNSITRILDGKAESIDYIDESRYDRDPKDHLELLHTATQTDEWIAALQDHVAEGVRVTGEWLGDRKDDLVDGAEATGEWLGDRKDDLVDGAEATGDWVEDRGEDAAEGISDAWGWAKDKVT
ncbi:alpha/beta hydrolase [Zhihengliuella sp.]|uniref:alpha/beta hydrolase n=1 Tax=Zhihengliuella sp. TaxID=1954483 RepID=UPI002810A1FC|nr:alpha/beta hydrolase [Zhihengliuella sp.]